MNALTPRAIMRALSDAGIASVFANTGGNVYNVISDYPRGSIYVGCGDWSYGDDDEETTDGIVYVSAYGADGEPMDDGVTCSDLTHVVTAARGYVSRVAR